MNNEQWRALDCQFTTGLRCFHRQPDIAAVQGSRLFPFSFSSSSSSSSFFFFFCTSLSQLFYNVNSGEWINSLSTVHVEEQWRAAPSPLPSTISTASQTSLSHKVACSSLFPSPSSTAFSCSPLFCKVNSGEWICRTVKNSLSTVHVKVESNSIVHGSDRIRPKPKCIKPGSTQ